MPIAFNFVQNFVQNFFIQKWAFFSSVMTNCSPSDTQVVGRCLSLTWISSLYRTHTSHCWPPKKPSLCYAKKVKVKCKNYTGKRKTLISNIKVCIFLFDTYMSFFLRIFWPSSLTEAAGEVLSYSSSTISWEWRVQFIIL